MVLVASCLLGILRGKGRIGRIVDGLGPIISVEYGKESTKMEVLGLCEDPGIMDYNVLVTSVSNRTK